MYRDVIEKLSELLLTIRSCKKQGINDKIILEYTFKKINEITILEMWKKQNLCNYESKKQNTNRRKCY